LDITAAIIADFRSYLPEFSDTQEWPDEELRRHLQDADRETGGSRWGSYDADPPTIKARGLFLYAAHQAVTRKAVRQAVANGQMPGQMAPTRDKSVGDESQSFAVPEPQAGGAAQATGNLESTFYGQEFRRLRHRAGSGAASTGEVDL